jgi:transcriptional regulator with XRE-family HTH domain
VALRESKTVPSIMTSSRTASSGDARTNELGSRIKERRRELGLKGAEVARQIGIDPRRYNNYETGKRKPEPTILKKISAALQTTSDQLLSSEPMLLGRDEQTYYAMQRFQEACAELSGEDVEMLADVAEFARRRRREESEQQARLAERDPFAPKLGDARKALAQAYERLLPAIIRTHRPVRVQTEMQEQADGGLRLFILVYYAGEPKDAGRSLIQLAKDRLPVRDSDLSIVRIRKDRIRKDQTELEVILEICCGTRRPSERVP